MKNNDVGDDDGVTVETEHRTTCQFFFEFVKTFYDSLFGKHAHEKER